MLLTTLTQGFKDNGHAGCDVVVDPVLTEPQHGPSLRGQRGVLTSVSGDLFRQAVPVRPVSLNGELSRRDGKIDAKTAGSHLANRRHADLCERLLQRQFDAGGTKDSTPSPPPERVATLGAESHPVGNAGFYFEADLALNTSLPSPFARVTSGQTSPVGATKALLRTVARNLTGHDRGDFSADLTRRGLPLSGFQHISPSGRRVSALRRTPNSRSVLQDRWVDGEGRSTAGALPGDSCRWTARFSTEARCAVASLRAELRRFGVCRTAARAGTIEGHRSHPFGVAPRVVAATPGHLRVSILPPLTRLGVA